MSRENVEALRAVYAEWGKGNLAAGAELFDPLVLCNPAPWLPGASRYYVGPEAVREFNRGWLEGWTQLTVVAEEVVEAGDSIVVASRQRGVGRGSGSEVNLLFFEVWTFRGRLVVRREGFRTRQEALEAVGLRE